MIVYSCLDPTDFVTQKKKTKKKQTLKEELSYQLEEKKWAVLKNYLLRGRFMGL